MANSADPDHLASSDCLLRQGMSCSAREGLGQLWGVVRVVFTYTAQKPLIRLNMHGLISTLLFLCHNPCHAEYIKMPCPLLIFSQSDNLIQVVDTKTNSHILNDKQCWSISVGLLQKPTNLDLHCLQKQGISGFSRTRVKHNFKGNFFQPESSDIFLTSWQKCMLWYSLLMSTHNIKT